MYDAAIIGTGPAGLSAALTLKLHNKNIVWFGSEALSDKVNRSEKIANYPGVPMTGGAELNKKFFDQAREMGLEMTDKRVTNIADMGDRFMVLADNDMYEARTVLLATGIAAAKGMENEARLLGMGVSYCATCDGFLYKGKTVAVVCTDERMAHDISYLEEICGKVYIYTSFGYTTDSENAEILKSPVKKLDGGMKCDSIELVDGTKLDVDGVFILRPAIAPTSLFSGLEMDGAHIKVSRSQETNYKGCFAAGDCTGRPYQIAKAVGEGCVAAHSMLEVLSAKA
ncbi:MAG: NAD(P)/FAD-dependent oxidoreductase [Mogibacterium sp.]|nr:NAD(P)/FAD-dependent oxidoreductase [Mogibacterium sp.]